MRHFPDSDPNATIYLNGVLVPLCEEECPYLGMPEETLACQLWSELNNLTMTDDGMTTAVTPAPTYTVQCEYADHPTNSTELCELWCNITAYQVRPYIWTIQCISNESFCACVCLSVHVMCVSVILLNLSLTLNLHAIFMQSSAGHEKMKNRLSSQFNLKIGSGIIPKSVIDTIPKWRTTCAKPAQIQGNSMVLQQFCTTLESALLLFTIFSSIY